MASNSSLRYVSLVDVFVRRPTLAIVINLLIIIAGIVAFLGVDVREMPAVDQPVLSVRASYEGASPEVVERQVTQVLEDALSRLEGLRSISSRSSYGSSRITIDLRENIDIDAASNNAREIVSQTVRQLPDSVDEPRILRNDADADPIVRMALSGDATIAELTAIAEGQIVDRLSSIEGVAEVVVAGNQRQQFRVEVDITSLLARGLTMDNVTSAISSLRSDAPLGALETGSDTLTLRTASEEVDTVTIENLRIDRTTRISDVAFVHLATEERRSTSYVDGQASVGIDVVRDSLGNTLAVSRDVKREIEGLQRTLPDGVSIAVTSDDGVFIEQSIREVVSSILMATAIVILTIFAFLGSVRATIIPAIAIPVALVGTVAAIWIAGFSINTITLLALVLATGLVVDDAIVVVENIVRKRREGMGRRAAAVAGAGEVFFAVLATTATLAAVFIPVSFLPGQAGGIFREFGFVLAFGVALSSIAALVLAPVIAAMVDPGKPDENAPHTAAGGSTLSRMFDRITDQIIRAPILVLAVSAGVAIIAFGLARDMPSEITPNEDRGFFVIVAQTSSGDNLDTMDTAIENMEAVLGSYRDAGLVNVVQSISGRGGGTRAFVIVRLTDWSDRNVSQQAIMAHISQEMSEIPNLTTFLRSSNSLGIRGGGGGGISFAVAGPNRDALEAATEALLSAMGDDPAFLSPQLSGAQIQPVLEVDIDREAARDLGLEASGLYSTINAMLQGQSATSVFVEGEELDIMLSAAGAGIQDTTDLEAIFIRSTEGDYVPLSAVATLRQVAASSSLDRQQRQPAIAAQANLGVGIGLGTAANRLDAIAADTLPAGTQLVLLGEAAAIEESARGFMIVFAVAFVIVLLVLAAQFESVTSALSVMITVPFGIAAAVIALWATGSTLNYYSQIGLVLLVGVMAKNGILIVEFANQLRAAGQGVDEAIRGAMRLRIRPVMMTMVSTVLGGLPLILSSGAGAEARAAVGWVIVGGLGFATVFTLTITPAVYRALSRIGATPGVAAAELDRELSEARQAASEARA